MSHRQIDGTLIVAQLKRRFAGGGLYKDVTVRTPDGRDEKLGTLVVMKDAEHALVPGSRGRFYSYNVMGSKGLYGFRPVSGKAYARFPRRWQTLSWGAAAVNLLVVLAWLMLDGSYAYWAASLFIMSLLIGAVYANAGAAAMSAYRDDDARGPTAAELRAALANS